MASLIPFLDMLPSALGVSVCASACLDNIISGSQQTSPQKEAKSVRVGGCIDNDSLKKGFCRPF